MADLKKIVQALAPPVLYGALSRLRHQPVPSSIRYLPSGWPAVSSDWNADAVAAQFEERWAEFCQEWRSPCVFAGDLTAQATYASYAYALLLACQNRSALSVMDWGGALGGYLLISRALAPGVEFDYHVRDLPPFVTRGRRLLPEAKFDDTDGCLDRRFDFVFASSSLQYAEDWRCELLRLAEATDDVLFVTRAPFNDSRTFAFKQNAYGSEWPGWSVSRAELIGVVRSAGLRLVREMRLSDAMPIEGAPATSYYGAFLFRR